MTRPSNLKGPEGEIRAIRPENPPAAGVVDDDVFPGALGLLPREIDLRSVVLAGKDDADEGKVAEDSKKVFHREEKR